MFAIYVKKYDKFFEYIETNVFPQQRPKST